MIPRTILGLALAALLPSLAGCNFMTFFEYEDDAPVQVIEKPSGFVPGSFGSTLLAVTDDDDEGRHLERLMVGARAPTPIFMYSLTEGSTVLPEGDETNRLCDPEGRETDSICATSEVGSAISLVTTWGDGVLCIAIGGAGDSAVVACDREQSSQRWDGDVNSGFGISVAGIPGEERILIGSLEETVWLGERGVEEATELDLGECTSTTEGFGSVVAASEDFWAIGSTGDEVVIMEPDGEGHARLSVAAGAGATLLVADLVGDATPDLAAGGAGEVRVWDGDDLLVAQDCDDVTPAAALSCRDVDDRGAECGRWFGAALAAGDIDADGTPELLVGDPSATVDGVSHAGGAWVYGAGALEDAPLDVLVDSFPEKDEEVGRAVTVGEILGRGEAIVGSDGEVLVFFCTALPGDGPGDAGLTESCRLQQ